MCCLTPQTMSFSFFLFFFLLFFLFFLLCSYSFLLNTSPFPFFLFIFVFIIVPFFGYFYNLPLFFKIFQQTPQNALLKHVLDVFKKIVLQQVVGTHAEVSLKYWIWIHVGLGHAWSIRTTLDPTQYTTAKLGFNNIYPLLKGPECLQQYFYSLIFLIQASPIYLLPVPIFFYFSAKQKTSLNKKTGVKTPGKIDR